jgi:hypothetical protein
MYYRKSEITSVSCLIREHKMKIVSVAAALALAAGVAAVSAPVQAATGLYATEDAAQKACQADEVVWVDLDRGKFYHKAQGNYGKGGNGGYACMKAAHAQYREAHD